jgi:alginate O-acetyltransferase complex protein AlgJ
MSTQRAQSLHAFIFAGVVVVLAIAALVSARSFRAPAMPDDVIDGRMTHAFESHYDQAFPVRTFGIALWAAIDYVLFREARSGAVVGRDGWLYTDEEFTVPNDAIGELARNLALISWVRENLSRQDVRLLMAIIPAKTRVYPEHLRTRVPPSLHQQLYGRALSHCQGLGIASPDLLAALVDGKQSQPTFLRTDTHWTPYGAQLAAHTLAASARRLLPKSSAGGGTFRIEKTVAQTHRGDLINFLPLDPYFAWLLPPAEQIDVFRTVKEGGGGGGDLLGDAQTPQVALVGTSYSAERDWNFPGTLEAALQRDVAIYAKEGQGPFTPMLDYLKSEDFRTSRPKLVIWELPERYLLAHQPLEQYHLPPEAFTIRARNLAVPRRLTRELKV